MYPIINNEITFQTQLFLQMLQSAAERLGIPLSEEQLSDCARFAEMIVETNRTTNLTRIVAPDAVAIKHFADSLTVFTALDNLPIGASVVDVGTGAGFPGIVLKIVRSDLRLTLIDSLGKRLTFLQSVIDELQLEDVTLIHARAEDAGRLSVHRDRYDVAVARAVAALPVLLEWCLPLVAVGRQFVAMKAESADGELLQSVETAKLLKATLEKDISLTLPAVGDEPPALRRLLVYRKIAPTPPKFPRKSVEIKTKPLG